MFLLFHWNILYIIQNPGGIIALLPICLLCYVLMLRVELLLVWTCTCTLAPIVSRVLGLTKTSPAWLSSSCVYHLDGEHDLQIIIQNSSGWSFISEAGFADTICILRGGCQARLRESYSRSIWCGSSVRGKLTHRI